VRWWLICGPDEGVVGCVENGVAAGHTQGTRGAEIRDLFEGPMIQIDNVILMRCECGHCGIACRETQVSGDVRYPIQWIARTGDDNWTSIRRTKSR
jgi:hypothetical protein